MKSQVWKTQPLDRRSFIGGSDARIIMGSNEAALIQLWREKRGEAQPEDLSGNRPDVPLMNAQLEGVGDRVAVRTADMRALPFLDASFDVVVSRAAIHNLYSADDRAAAIREIARVLKPGGMAVIADIRHHNGYARTFAENGCGDVRLMDSRLFEALCTLLTIGSLRPNTMLVAKPRA